MIISILFFSIDSSADGKDVYRSFKEAAEEIAFRVAKQSSGCDADRQKGEVIPFDVACARNEQNEQVALIYCKDIINASLALQDLHRD